jgi:hypothetical protein
MVGIAYDIYIGKRLQIKVDVLGLPAIGSTADIQDRTPIAKLNHLIVVLRAKVVPGGKDPSQDTAFGLRDLVHQGCVKRRLVR